MILELLVGGAILAAAGGIGYVRYETRRQKLRAEEDRQAARTAFQAALLLELRSTKLSEFRFSAFVEQAGIDRAKADSIAKGVFHSMVLRASRDAVITADERRTLDRLGVALEIPADQCGLIENEAKREVYGQAVRETLNDGSICEAEAASLRSLRRSLGLSDAQAFSANASWNREAFLSTLRRIVADGVVTPAERRELERCRSALAFSDEQADQAIRGEALEIYRQCFSAIAQDGVVLPEEEDSLRWLQDQAGLSGHDVEPYLRRLRDLKAQAEYRKGRLPVVPTRKMLEGGEVCHWEGQALYKYATTRSEYQVMGDLVISSKAVYYTSPSKSFSFSPSKLHDLAVIGPGLDVHVLGTKGTGFYRVKDPRLVESILHGLVGNHKFLVAMEFGESRSRRIPPEVKRAVWARDGGRCVACGAVDYLEYDHEIPFSRGGSNGERNIRLLCRRCNLAKGDRIG